VEIAANGQIVYISLLGRSEFAGIPKDRKKHLTNALDCDRLGELIRLRTRLPGDSISLAGRGVTKTLKKLFNERAVPLTERAGLLMLEDVNRPGEGLLWLEGFGPAERCAAREDTERYLLIHISEDNRCGAT
jgi:tRNA(Ile)-lysidine synthase